MTARLTFSLAVSSLLFAGSCFAQSRNAAAAKSSADFSASSDSVTDSGGPGDSAGDSASSAKVPKIDAAHPTAPQADSIASRMAAGLTVSSLGIGGQFVVRIIHRGNVRVGFNDFSLSHTFNGSGITYGAKVNLRTFQATFDYFVVGLCT